MIGFALGAAPTLALSQADSPWSDPQRLERFLEEARIVERKKVETGVTGSVRVTLELDGERQQAIMKKIDEPDDSWRHEVAAYELDRLLGLGLVPPTVKRRDRGRAGCLQLWVNGTTLEARSEPPDLEMWRQQVSAMWLFDYLTANNDRHLNNALVSPEYRLMLIDNSRAFGTYGTPIREMDEEGGATRAMFWRIDFDPDLERYPTIYGSDLVERLRSLTDERLENAIGSYIGRRECRRLLERRDTVQEKIEARQVPPQEESR